MATIFSYLIMQVNLLHKGRNMSKILVFGLWSLLFLPSAAIAETAFALFAGGCFWCMEPPFDKLPGVITTESGYTGGTVANPRYAQVSSGTTGHAEALKITYNPSQVSYAQLLIVFWHNIDPLAKDQQFCDAGNQYRSAIFYQDETQRQLAEQSKQQIATELKGQPIHTAIVAATVFYPAEEYHQNYYQKNPLRYRYYRAQCGRDQRLEQLWGKTKTAH